MKAKPICEGQSQIMQNHTKPYRTILGVMPPANYSFIMENAAVPKTALIMISVLIALIGISGLGGWIATGDDLFMSLIQTGMRWCF